MSTPKRRPTDAPCVLVIEDDPDARQIYAEYFRMKGWNAFSAADGRVGLNKTMDLTPDVVVLDLAMPRVDGWTVLKELRESSMTSQIAIVVVSAIPDSRDRALEAGADAYLEKPCAPHILFRQSQALTRLRSGASLV
jgi:DNA-binding response OmpR family regulator